MAKINKTIAKLKNLYTEFGHEYTPYSAKEIKEVKKTIELPKTLEEYYKKIGSFGDDEFDFMAHVVLPSDLSFLDGHLVFAHEMQGVCSFSIKKEDLTLDNPPVYSNVDGKGWQLASSRNDEETNFDNLLEFFYAIAQSMGVDPEPRNTEKNVKIVRAVLTGDLSEDAITDEVIKNITYLDFDRLEITNLQAITKLKNLFNLKISNSNINTIEYFFDLPKLEYLNCNNNGITNIDGAERMKKLLWFFIYRNKITDISPLAKMKNVTALFLSQNNIEDISPIAKMENLDRAVFEGNRIKDISVIATMPQLKRFDANNNQIEQLPNFQENAQLYDLRLDDNKISNVDPLTRLKKLNVLWLRGNPIKDTSVFKKLEYVEHLVVDE